MNYIKFRKWEQRCFYSCSWEFIRNSISSTFNFYWEIHWKCTEMMIVVENFVQILKKCRACFPARPKFVILKFFCVNSFRNPHGTNSHRVPQILGIFYVNLVVRLFEFRSIRYRPPRRSHRCSSRPDVWTGIFGQSFFSQSSPLSYKGNRVTLFVREIVIFFALKILKGNKFIKKVRFFT